jgi:DNA-binding Lrp family transcriptional regulator
MLVHDIPDGEVERIGNALAQAEGVTLCYRRPRVLPDWPYNLFCMIHGQAREEVEARIATLRRDVGLERCAHDVLFSLTRFKQTGARYA